MPFTTPGNNKKYVHGKFASSWKAQSTTKPQGAAQDKLCWFYKMW